MLGKASLNCYCSQGGVKRFGHYRNKNRIVQRYRCLSCGRCFSESQPLDGLRVETDKAIQVVKLLVEGVGIRAISRLTGLHQETVLNVLEKAGKNCARILNDKIYNVQVEAVEADELFAYVGCKQRNNLNRDYDRGDQYLFLAIDAKSKLIISHNSGKRDAGQTLELIEDLGKRIQGHFQLTTDGYEPYQNCVKWRLNGRVDFAQLIKSYSPTPNGSGPEARYSPGACTGVKAIMRAGNPNPAKISTSYVERTNLSIRLFNRRFTRLTLGYSKKVEFHRYAIALQVCHFNFCRVHSAHKQTPAVAIGIADRIWTVEDLLNYPVRPNFPQPGLATN